MIITIRIYVFLLIALYASFVLAETYGRSGKDKTVIQSSHFNSKTDQSAKYTLSNVEAEKPLVFLLKKKANSKSDISGNPLTVTFNSQNQTYSCKLKSYSGLCVIEEVVETSISLNIECFKVPCDVSWVIYQPEINRMNAGQLGQGLFKLDESQDHMVVFVTCNDPENKQFANDVLVYSSSHHFQRGSSEDKLYFLFSNQQQGFLYIDIKEKSRKCAHMSIASVPRQVQYSEKLKRDFTNQNSPSIISLKKPKGDFRLDCMLNKLDSSAFTASTTISLKKIIKNSSQIISKYLIAPIGKEKNIEFSITFKQPEGTYDSLQLEITGQNDKMTVINYVINQAEIQEVDISERNYFNLKKGQNISYQLLPNEDAEDSDTIYFLLSNSTNIELSLDNCSAQVGCTIQLTAEENVSAYLYFSATPNAPKQDIQYIPLQKKSKQKIKETESIFFKKKLEANKAFEVAVNSPNVIVYAASKEKCRAPDASCNERSGNYLHPFAYSPKEDGQFIIKVEGLDSGQFIITIIQEEDEYIHLDDGVAFSYRIEEDEDELIFKFHLKEQSDVSFNLVAPLNHLSLLVFNGEGEPNELSTSVSSDGFINIPKEQLKSLRFVITVKKTDLTKKKLTHFTLIASSSKALIRLEPTVVYYQTLQSKASREYIFEYDPAEDYILNFYTHNFKNKDVEIMFALSNDRVWDKNNLDMLWVKHQSDYLDLRSVSNYLCRKQGEESCEIFLLLKNGMEVEVDITITLLMRYSIIELKDGIWQSFLQGTIASDANFYFYPKHSDKNTVILYSTSMEDLRLSYTLWKSDSKSLNPSEWPFPREDLSANHPSMRTVNHVTIDKQQLKKQCWPDCIVLITLFRDRNLVPQSRDGNADFKIMASNNQIQLPEQTRVNLVLSSSQEKQLIVDLKYALTKQYLTFYTSHTIGSFALFANVISQKQQRCPQETQDVDFRLLQGETVIDVRAIKSKIQELKMQDDGNIYFCLLVKGIEDGKFSIEYVSDKKDIQLVHANSFQMIKLQANETKMYQIDGYYNFIAKIVRRSGYPYLFTQKCDMDSLKACQQEFVTSNQTGKQLVKKSQKFDEGICKRCVYFFKFHTVEPSSVVLHINSRNSETELKEHEIITEFIEQDEEGRYSITHIQNEDLLVNIHVIQGEIQATITNFVKINLIKSTEPEKKTIHFFIPKSFTINDNFDKSQDSVASFGSFEYSSIFGSFHLVLKNKNPNSSSTYQITYSSGQNQVQLQDGLITDIALQPNIPLKFFYQNQISTSHIFLTISAKDENILSSLNISTFYFEYEGEEENRVQFHLDIPKIRKKTPNPTYLLSLPQKNYFQINLLNPGSLPEVVSIGINNQELIILPFDHEFPFVLHAHEDINFIVEVSSPGYIHAQIRKCDQSEPIFSYSFDYDSFVKGDFQNEIELNQSPKFQDFIKITKAGSFYVNIKAEQSSVLAIHLTFLTDKPKTKLLKAGNKGLIEYELSESRKATLHFRPVLCQTSECLGIKYYSMASSKLEDLYYQLFCPSSFFSTNSIQTTESIPLIPIQYQEKSLITFTQNMTSHYLFVAVKAVTGSGQEIYYGPIEVATIWGHLSKTSQGYKLTVGCVIVVSICALLLFVRHNARKGYRRVQESDHSR